MGVIRADTDGLLDRCSDCGERAGFEKLLFITRARCTDCCEQTEWFKDKFSAMIDWNLSQRKQGREKKQK
jgi:uncharacterized protein (DUF983 family)